MGEDQQQPRQPAQDQPAQDQPAQPQQPAQSVWLTLGTQSTIQAGLLAVTAVLLTMDKGQVEAMFGPEIGPSITRYWPLIVAFLQAAVSRSASMRDPNTGQRIDRQD
jgi:uncharacterized protein (DUF39 family)